MSDLTPCPREDCKATECERMLDAVLPELLVKAWDEGRDLGLRQADYEYGVSLGMPDLSNPYRKAKQ